MTCDVRKIEITGIEDVELSLSVSLPSFCERIRIKLTCFVKYTEHEKCFK